MPTATRIDRWTLINALTTAAGAYDISAVDMRIVNPAQARIAEQLARQATEARRLADAIQDADNAIELTD